MEYMRVFLENTNGHELFMNYFMNLFLCHGFDG